MAEERDVVRKFTPFQCGGFSPTESVLTAHYLLQHSPTTTMETTATASYSTQLSDEQTAVRNLARDFAREIRPVVMEFDESQIPSRIVRQNGRAGIFGDYGPTRYGGSGLGSLEAALIVEEIARVDPSVALGVAAHNGLCTGAYLEVRIGGTEAGVYPHAWQPARQWAHGG